MYPGKLLSLTNKGWGWAPLLKHVGFEWKKKKGITSEVWRILEQKKWRSKDQNSKKFKSWRYQKSIQIRWWIQRDQMSKKWRIPQELYSGINDCNSRLCMLRLLN